jgi:predicted phage terminase large subunit-like protein
MMKREIPFVVMPATDDGKLNGTPIFLSNLQWESMKREQGSHTTYLQNLLNPKGSKERQLDPDDLQFYPAFRPSEIKENLITYILVDPANEKKKKSDYSAFIVIGCGQNGNVYILEIVRDKLNPTERIDMLFELHKDYKPLKTGYEKYGLQSDIHHIKEAMNEKRYHFKIDELGGQTSKIDRIRNSLQPLLESKRLYIPPKMRYIDYLENEVDLTEAFQIEMESFPVGEHDDMLDALARLGDIGLVFPQDYEEDDDERQHTQKDETTGY